MQAVTTAARQALEHAYALEEQNAIAAALTACNKALMLAPEWAEAYNFQGMLLDALERPREAISAYQQATYLDPDFADAHQNLVEALAEQNLYFDEEEKAWGYLELAYAYDGENDPGAALAACDAALAMEPEWAEAHNLRGIQLDALGRTAEARAAYQTALQLDPELAGVEENLEAVERDLAAQEALTQAENYLRANALEAALETCRIALENAPDLPEAHLLHGQILESQQQPTAALEAYREARTRDATLEKAVTAVLRLELAENERNASPSPQAWQQLERAYRYDAAGNTLQALTACDEVLAQCPQWAEAHNLRGLLLEILELPEDALEAYDRALQLAPDFSDARDNRQELRETLQARPHLAQAQTYLEAGDHYEAVLACNQALTLAPQLAAGFRLRGAILEAMGKEREALEAYRRGVAVEPDADSMERIAQLAAQLYGDPVIVATTSNFVKAQIIKGRLEVEGIAAQVEHPNAASVFPNTFSPYHILVPAEDAVRAQDLLRAEPV